MFFKKHHTRRSEIGGFKLPLLPLLLACLITLGMSDSRAPAKELSDAEISNAVIDALMLDHGVSGVMIDVQTNNGIVTISGEVNNILAKKRATAIAETVKGVRSVINTIEVRSTGMTDSEIAESVRTALIFDPATDSWEINVKVNDGVVTLTGNVDSWQEKWLAGKVAEGVAGVRDLNNRIEVNVNTSRSDSEIKTEIEQALKWDALVDGALIDVKVDNGHVTLSGTVGSAAEKNYAEMDCWVAGVVGVNNDINVESWARDSRFRKDKYKNLSDPGVKRAVNDALFYDPRVNSFDANVEVDNGTVTLEGTVDNLKAKRAAAQTARNTVGVWRVKNRIKVRPAMEYSDATIEKRVEKALMRDPYVNRYDLGVSVLNGEVYLTGDVDSYFEKAQADDVASRINGVVAVNNNIKVEDKFDVMIYDPYLYSGWWDVYDYDWYAYPDRLSTTKTDWEIKEDIEDELWWSPFVDSDEVDVEVKDGVAALKGTVDTYAEKTAATENAFEGGAIAVDNDLRVKNGPPYYIR